MTSFYAGTGAPGSCLRSQEHASTYSPTVEAAQ